MIKIPLIHIYIIGMLLCILFGFYIGKYLYLTVKSVLDWYVYDFMMNIPKNIEICYSCNEANQPRISFIKSKELVYDFSKEIYPA